MKIVIIEDETLAANKLEKMILKYRDSFQVIEKLGSVESAREWLTTHEMPDLLFLDIQLSDGTSFDLLKTITITCPVIFTTAYDHFALEAFQLHSVDYLLKPVSQDKLAKALDKLDAWQQRYQQMPAAPAWETVIKKLEGQQQAYKSRFLIKSGTRYFPISTAETHYFFSAQRITFLVTAEGKRYTIGYTLDDLANELDPADFFRINRKMIINIKSIQMVHKHFNGRLKVDLEPSVEEEVMVSSRRVADFQDWLDR